MTSIKPLKDDVFVSIFSIFIFNSFKTFCCLAGARFCNTGTFNIEYTEQKIRFVKEKKCFCTNNNKNQQLKYSLQQTRSTQRSITVIDVSKEDLPVIDFVT
jgi:hypothetical protein